MVVMSSPLAVDLAGRDLLRPSDFVPAESEAVLELAMELKARPRHEPLLPGRSLGLLFYKHSTRTRVSFAAGMTQLGGAAIPLEPEQMQLSRGESLHDTAEVLSRYLDAIAIRTYAQADLEAWAEASSIPIVNALTDEQHPCQALADVLTIRERLGGTDGVRIAWLGDGTNVLVSLAELGAQLGITTVAACPEGYDPPELAGTIVRDPREAVAGADVVVTDTWTSMGQEDGARAAAARPRAVPRRREAAEARASGRDRAALPARASGRGDRGRRALRPAVGRVGRSREPPARAEGAARAAARRVASGDKTLTQATGAAPSTF